MDIIIKCELLVDVVEIGIIKEALGERYYDEDKLTAGELVSSLDKLDPGKLVEVCDDDDVSSSEEDLDHVDLIHTLLNMKSELKELDPDMEVLVMVNLDESYL